MRKIILSILTLFLLTFTIYGEVQRVYLPSFSWTSPKVIAMGGAYIADTQGFSTLFTNPAGFSHGESELTLMALQANLLADPFALYDKTLDGSISDDMAAIVVENIVTNGLGVGGNLGFGWTGRNLGFGMFITNDLVFPQERMILNASGQLISDIVFVSGYAYDFYFWEDQIRLSCGMDVRPMYRSLVNLTLDQALNIAGLGGEEFDILSIGTNAGWAIAFDAGVTASYRSFGLSMVLRDIGNTTYVLADTTLEDLQSFDLSGDRDLSIQYMTPMSLIIGTSWEPDMGSMAWLIKPHFQISYKTPIIIGYDELDLVDYYSQSFYTKIHGGVDLELFTILSLRAGYNSGYLTAGTSVDFKVGEFSFTIYSEELGISAGQQQQLGAIAELRLKLEGNSERAQARREQRRIAQQEKQELEAESETLE